MPMTARHTGFTLIELLVVVSIIGLLAAMLLPALTLVRNAANKSSCLSRLRQVGLVLNLYAENNEAAYPPIVGGLHAGFSESFGGTLQGFGFLFPDYLERDQAGNPRHKLLRCPSYDRRSDVTFGYGYYGNVRDGSTPSGSVWTPQMFAPNNDMPAFAAGPGLFIGLPGRGASNVALTYERLADDTNNTPFHPHPLDEVRRAGFAFPLLPGGNVLFADGHGSWLAGNHWKSSQNGSNWMYYPMYGY